MSSSKALGFSLADLQGAKKSLAEVAEVKEDTDAKSSMGSGSHESKETKQELQALKDLYLRHDGKLSIDQYVALVLHAVVSLTNAFDVIRKNRRNFCRDAVQSEEGP